MEKRLQEIPLTQGKVALIDDEDYPAVNQYKWNAVKDRTIWRQDWKAVRHIYDSKIKKQRTQYLSQFLLPNQKDFQIGYRNGNTLDNRRENLLFATHQELAFNKRIGIANKTGLKGIYKDRDYWRADIGINGKTIHLGCYGSMEEAARAYDDAATKHFGKFARLNFPDSQTIPEITSCDQKSDGSQLVWLSALRSAQSYLSTGIIILLSKFQKTIQKKSSMMWYWNGRFPRTLAEFWQHISEVETNPEYFSWGRSRTRSAFWLTSLIPFIKFQKAWS
jgi:hypothetical protein